MNKKEFSRRRQQLMERMGPNSIAILPNASVAIRNRDVHYPYRSDSHFFYLSGFDEPESVIVLIPGRAHGEYLLFCRERNPEREMWDGRRSGQTGAVNDYDADDAYHITDLEDILPGLLEEKDKVFYTIGNIPTFDQKIMGFFKQLKQQQRHGKHAPMEIVELDHYLNELRLYKSAQEIKALRQAITISAKAHIRAMQFSQPGVWEYQVEGEITHEFYQHGCRSAAYPSIVGGGANGCILHYIENQCQLKDDTLLLIDAGAEYDYYAGDITRTFPVNGRYNTAQKIIYQIVLDAQKAAIAEVKPGNHWNQPHEAAVAVLTAGLLHIGILQGELSTLIETQAYKPFYMHRTGHWLGMDVHDVGDYKIDGQWRLLEAGMVLTVEPGLYIQASETIDKKWHDIAVRIEDDVLVTATGHEVLSALAPKEIDEIEQLMAKAS